ncbi:hypothetical protein JRQ81_019391 [Phrynocephalus forsythii]|uniref:Reverse transcriptase RNase H-like domain-containing protein n=1 Tax=Phrynocephalus forsythii TaxID=171643 RepID=A0A9Q1AYQ8_9SAUR|nr:hypothetical protein JRQ81_019391 [Phrynocephalus forsythii]
MKLDLQVWLEFLGHFNGKAIWQCKWLPGSSLQVQSDAARGTGFGIYCMGSWCARKWPPAWAREGINWDLTFLELFPIVAAVIIWRDIFKDKQITFWCDNQAVVAVINRQSSKSGRVMRLVRRLVSLCLSANVTFRSKFVPGLDNGIPDSLSHFQFDRFRTLAPWANSEPDPFPEDLWSLGNKK